MKQSIPAIFSLGVLILSLMGGCVPASTPEASAPPQKTINTDPHTIAEVEKLAGFDVKEPTYLPKGVSFEFATFQTSPNPYVTLHFKLVHETYGDMGAFFQIVQEMQSEAPPDVLACSDNTEDCEILQIDSVPVVYHQNPAGPEGLDWYADGFVFRLLRTAGEPNKVYKDELMKVVESMK